MIETEVIAVGHEVTADNKSVSLKAIHHRIRLRQGFGEGADVDLSWHRARPQDVHVELKSMSVFLDWCFRGVVVGAGLIAFYFSIQKKVLSNVRVWYLFVLAFAGLMVPYYCLRFAMSIKGRSFLDSVEVIVRREIGS